MERKQYEKEVQAKFEKEQKLLDEKVIQMMNVEKANDNKLLKKRNRTESEEYKDEATKYSNSIKDQISKMSKKRRQKIEKILDDNSLSQPEKEAMIS